MLAVESQGERAEAVPPAAGIISQPIIDVKPARANFELHENCSESVCLCVSACARAAAAAAAALTRGRAGGRGARRAGGRALHSPALPAAPLRPRGAGRTPGRALPAAGPHRPPKPRARRAHASHQAENSPAAGRLRGPPAASAENAVCPADRPPDPGRLLPGRSRLFRAGQREGNTN